MINQVIKSLTPNGTWEGKYGVNYKFDVEFESGEGGECNAKTDTPPYRVGTTVVAACTGEFKGKKRWSIQLPKPQFGESNFTPQGATSQGGKSQDTQERITTQWAIREAQTYIANTVSNPSGITLREVAGYALQFKSMASDLTGYVERAKNTETQRDENLPF